MTSKIFHLGLIGFPLSHSLSPRIHTAALRSCGLEGDYSLYPIHPDDYQSLEDLFARLPSGEIQGLNVTIPHKQNVIEFLEELTPTAKSIGAVNTIYVRNKKLIGDNTDAMGFITDLHRFLDPRKSKIDNRKSRIVNRRLSLVLGAGGSARAVIYALLNDGWEVTVAARRLEQAEQLADSFMDDRLQISDFALSNIELSSISLILNTTPVGMTPNTDYSPWPQNLPFPVHAAIYDLVYNPRETKLVQDARRQGLPARTGLGMLIEQAALSFQIWTGCKPLQEAMLEAVSQIAY
jgi:shikimate dehydrogenase